ncbi:MAG: HD domain-containing protein, partial [Acidobacteria bacterium]|nr:HD domain-containing protein [Acidobacteriota bacterium]
VALVVALEKRVNVFRLWRDKFLWTSLTYFTGASIAALVAVNVQSITPAVIGVVVPMLGVTYFTYKTYLDKVLAHIRHLQELNELYLRTVESLALAVDAKDQSTYGHLRRVRAYAMGLARLAGVTDPKALLALETGSLLHDIGKLSVDDYILSKPGRLTEREFDKMKRHSAAGAEILAQIRFPFPVAEYVRSHHERWDGSGYPDGLQGEQIPIGARILIIADTFDALRSSRPYKSPLGIRESLETMMAESGRTYDARLLELFLSHIDELEAAAAEACRNIPQPDFRRNPAETEGGEQPGPPRVVPPPGVAFELVALHEFCEGPGPHLHLHDLLPVLERRLDRIIPFTTCVFYLKEDGNLLTAVHAGGELAARLQGSTAMLGKGISGWVAAFDRPMLGADPRREFERLQGEFEVLCDSLAVPLRADQESLGTIALFSRERGAYSESDLGALQTVADLVGPLIAAAASRARRVPAGTLPDSEVPLKRQDPTAVVVSHFIP